jgi:hypothetical protein
VPYDWSTALPGMAWSEELPGVFSRHDDGCPVRYGRRCICGPLGYFATFVDPATNRQVVSPLFAAVADAQQWQAAQGTNLIAPAAAGQWQPQPSAASSWQPEQQQTVTARQVVGGGDGDLGAVIDEFLEAAQDGRSRELITGEPYTRERLRELRGALSYADSELGTLKVQDVRRRNVQALIDQLRAAGLSGERVTSVADALRVVYSHAIQRGLVDYSPVVDLVLPPADNGNGQQPTDQYANGMLTGQAMPTPAGFETPMGYPTPGGYGTPPVYPTPPTYGTPPTYATPGAFLPTNGYPPPMGYPTSPGAPAPTGFPAFASPQTIPGYSTSQGMPASNGHRTSNRFASRILGSPPSGASDSLGDYDSTQQERFLWWTVRIVVIVFVLIALVLVAESV